MIGDIVSDSRHVYPNKNYDEPYSPRMVPVAKNYWVWLKAYKAIAQLRN